MSVLQFPILDRADVVTLEQVIEIETSLQAFPSNIAYSPAYMRRVIGSYRLMLEALRRVDPANPLLRAAKVPEGEAQ